MVHLTRLNILECPEDESLQFQGTPNSLKAFPDRECSNVASNNCIPHYLFEQPIRMAAAEKGTAIWIRKFRLNGLVSIPVAVLDH